MWQWLKQKCRTSIVDQVEDELYQCSRDLLEAEGILERAQANVAMLQARDERLRKRMAPDMGVPLYDQAIAFARAQQNDHDVVMTEEQAAGLVNACRARATEATS